MAAERPCVVQGKKQGKAHTEFGQHTQIEIIAVQIVCLQNVGLHRRKIEQTLGCGEGKVLMAKQSFPCCIRASHGSHPGSRTAGNGIDARRSLDKKARQGVQPVCFRNGENALFVRQLAPDGQMGRMAPRAIRPVQPQRHRLGAAAAVESIDLQNIHWVIARSKRAR